MVEASWIGALSCFSAFLVFPCDHLCSQRRLAGRSFSVLYCCLEGTEIPVDATRANMAPLRFERDEF